MTPVLERCLHLLLLHRTHLTPHFLVKEREFMRKRVRRSAFTLVELLVVMSIIAILAAMLMPAVNAVREQARRTQCTNNMRNVALALVQHDANKGVLPGFRDYIPGTTNSISWVYPTLPYIERNDIYKAYGANGPRRGDTPSEFIKIITCPNDGTARSGTNMSYVVNSGVSGNNDTFAHAVFHAIDNVNNPVRVSLSMISGGDGTAQTLMLSENIDATRWTTPNGSEVTFTYDARYYINEKIGGKPGWDRARPSAYHPGGVVVSFCDPHVVFMNESIDPQVWELLFTPNGAAAGQTRLLSEEDLGSL